MKRFLEFIESNIFTKAIALSVIVCLIVGLAKVSLLKGLDFNSIDMMYNKRKQAEVDPRITIWTIFDDDLEKINRWPWSWDRFTEILDVWDTYDAHTGMIMETNFSEVGRLTISKDSAKKLRKQMKKELKAGKTYEEFLKGKVPNHNERLVTQMKKMNNLAMSQHFIIPDHQDDAEELKQKLENRKAFFNESKKSAVDGIRKFGVPWDDPGQLLQAIDVVPLTPMLADVTKYVGFQRIIHDADGVIRRAPTVVYYDGTVFFSQAIINTANFFNCPIENIELIPGKHILFKGVKAQKRPGDLSIPIDEKGMMYVNWIGKDQMKYYENVAFKGVRDYLIPEMLKRASKNIDIMEFLENEDNYRSGAITYLKNYLLNTGFIKEENINDVIIKHLNLMLTKAYYDANSDKTNVSEEVKDAFDLIKEITKFCMDDLEMEFEIPVHSNFEIYESIRLNTHIYNLIKNKKEVPPYEELIKQLKIHRGYFRLHYLGSYAITEDLISDLLETDLLEVADEWLDGEETIDYALKVKNYRGSQDDFLNKVVVGMQIEPKELEKIKEQILRLQDFAKKYDQVLKQGYEQTIFLAKKGLLDESSTLYFPEPKFYSLKSGDYKASLMQVQNKAVFIGVTATGLNALNPTPFQGRDSMVGLTPTMFNTILTESFIREEAWTEAIFVIAYSLIIILITYRLPFFINFPFFIILSIAHGFSCFYIFENHGIIIATNSPILCIIFSYLATILYQYWEQQKERAQIRGMFAAMVSPEVLKIMEEDPDKFDLQGQKVYASMFSSDVSGFTSISEGVTAQELALILNLYLTPMSNLVMIYGGYVEKYEGDAIKADFGMPIEDDGHAWKACYSAILQQEELFVVQRMLQLKYGVMITARMGVNTGDVSAGNMGSVNKMQYCAIGHEVAMAEELEPSNKMWETWIAISEETRRMSGDTIKTRLLDNVIFDHEVIPVFEVLGWNKEHFLKLWLGKPIPALIIEGWNKIIPEKVLAYINYYEEEKHQYSDNGFYDIMMDAYKSLEDDCIEYTYKSDKINVYQLDINLQNLDNEIKALGKPLDESKLAEVDVTELNGMQKDLDNASETWEQYLRKHLINLKNHSHIINQNTDSLEQAKMDDFNNRIDTFEKNCNCYIKRNAFPDEDDKFGTLFKDHLREILQNPNQGLNEANIENYQNEISSILGKIKTEMSSFIVKAKTAPDEYHKFIAEHGLVSDKKLEVVDIFASGRELYLAQKWDEADEKFKHGLTLVEDDGPCITFSNRCRDFKENPPAKDWNGDWVADW